MKESQALSAFQARAHELYTCFTFAAAGLNREAERFRPLMTGQADQAVFIGNTDPGQGKPQARINAQDLVEHSSRDGSFTDTLAKALIVLLYSEWDEVCRHLIAAEFGASYRAVSSDLMGDLRHVRHWIVHSKSVVGTNAFKVLAWQLAPGATLAISQALFAQFMDQLNEMQVDVEV